MAGFGKVSGRLAPRDAINNEFFRWLTKPSSFSAACWSTMVLCHTKGRLGITAAGSLAMSKMAHVLADRTKESGQVRSRFVHASEVAAE
jgi:hypothetical protein